MTQTAKKDNDMYIDHEQRITRLEANQNNTANILLRIENNLREMDARIEKRFERIETRLDSMENRISSNFRFLSGLIIGSYVFIFASSAGILGVMAKGFHWI